MPPTPNTALPLFAHLLLKAALALPIAFAAGCASHDQSASTTDSPVSPAATNSPDTLSAPAAKRSAPALDQFTEVAGLRVEHAAWASLGYRWSWTTAPVLTGGASVQLAEPLGDLIAVVNSRSRLTAIEATSGRIRWNTAVATPLTDFVALARAGDQIQVFSRRAIYIHDALSGEFATRQDLAIAVTTPPALASGVAYFGSPTSRALAHRYGDEAGLLRPPPLDRGVQLWQYLLTGAIDAMPALMGNAVAFVAESGDILFADPLSGAATGRASVAGPPAANPVTDGSLLYIASRDQSVYAFDTEGRLVWRHRTAVPLQDQITVHDGVLYAHVPGEGLLAFNASDGSVLWKNPDARGTVVALRAGELIAFAPGRAWMIDARRGDTLAQPELTDIARLMAPAFDSGPLFAVGRGGAIARFDPR